MGTHPHNDPTCPAIREPWKTCRCVPKPKPANPPKGPSGVSRCECPWTQQVFDLTERLRAAEAQVKAVWALAEEKIQSARDEADRIYEIPMQNLRADLDSARSLLRVEREVSRKAIADVEWCVGKLSAVRALVDEAHREERAGTGDGTVHFDALNDVLGPPPA